MRIAVTTPTGHVGSVVADFLLDFGKNIRVRLLARRPEKLRSLVARGAELAIGSQDDADYLTRATEAVDVLFWATPPGYGSDNVRAMQNRFGQAAAKAIRANQIARVVNLSSIGAQWDSGVGPVGGLHDIEEVLNGVAPHIVHLRPGFFYENWLGQLDRIRKWGQISLPVSANRRIATIATRDIGRVAATWLARQDWSGRVIQELHGPADLTYREIADIFSDALERKITYTRCEPDEMRHLLVDNAMSENAADLMLELCRAVEMGKLEATLPLLATVTTATTLAEFAHEILLPLVSRSVSRMREI
jgi:uncharacterized protein YbjT (DUF2867 family)